IGGWWSQVMLAQRVTIKTKNGNLTGVIGSKPPHILSPEARKKPVEIKDMFIDIGASSKEEAEAFGVRPGDSVIPYFEFTQMNNYRSSLDQVFLLRHCYYISIVSFLQFDIIQLQIIVYLDCSIQV